MFLKHLLSLDDTNTNLPKYIHRLAEAFFHHCYNYLIQRNVRFWIVCYPLEAFAKLKIAEFVAFCENNSLLNKLVLFFFLRNINLLVCSERHSGWGLWKISRCHSSLGTSILSSPLAQGACTAVKQFCSARYCAISEGTGDVGLCQILAVMFRKCRVVFRIYNKSCSTSHPLKGGGRFVSLW